MNTPKKNTEILQDIYNDLGCISKYAADDIVLHTSDQGTSGRTQIVGKENVVAKELDLIRLTGRTLKMDVEQIIANEHFGAVIGTLHARNNGFDIEMPFCGLWRFHKGKIVEHWENAYDVVALEQFLTT